MGQRPQRSDAGRKCHALRKIPYPCSMAGKRLNNRQGVEQPNNQMFGKLQPTAGKGPALVMAIGDLVKRFHMVIDYQSRRRWERPRDRPVRGIEHKAQNECDRACRPNSTGRDSRATWSAAAGPL